MNIAYSENSFNALIACGVSGLSTGIGGLFILFYGEPDNRKLGHMLSFSGGVMLYISFMDLLTESIAKLGFMTANLWFFVGMLFFLFIIRFFPEPKISKTDKAKTENGKPSHDAYLKHVGIVTAVGISLHNFPEGMAVYVSCLKGIAMGLPLTLAIAAHNIPEGMAVAAPMYAATGSKWLAFMYSFLSGLCEPLGAIIFGIIFGSYLTDYIIQSMLAGVAGIMVFMVVGELMPATFKYIKKGPATVSFIIGMFVIFLSVYYLHGMLPHDHTPLYSPFPQEIPLPGLDLHTHDHSHHDCGHHH
eukprot:TRINITY_DN2502_c0_g3_i1.p1 TRINITY_DN2502_c0_g3~~TRINITY_DN2502_c0_g3_i1.p1  ORF type:complete len:302 (-),score=33.57 TRINITY_DN2502_c0_g3_i1:110-1015(-)